MHPRAGQFGNVQWYGIRRSVEVAHSGKEKWENITVACNASVGTGLIFQFCGIVSVTLSTNVRGKLQLRSCKS